LVTGAARKSPEARVGHLIDPRAVRYDAGMEVPPKGTPRNRLKIDFGGPTLPDLLDDLIARAKVNDFTGFGETLRILQARFPWWEEARSMPPPGGQTRRAKDIRRRQLLAAAMQSYAEFVGRLGLGTMVSETHVEARENIHGSPQAECSKKLAAKGAKARLGDAADSGATVNSSS
jgi:hypothetical protein